MKVLLLCLFIFSFTVADDDFEEYSEDDDAPDEFGQENSDFLMSSMEDDHVDEADLEADKDDPLKTLEKAVTESKIHESYKMEIDHLKQQLTAMQADPAHVDSTQADSSHVDPVPAAPAAPVAPAALLDPVEPVITAPAAEPAAPTASAATAAPAFPAAPAVPAAGRILAPVAHVVETPSAAATPPIQLVTENEPKVHVNPSVQPKALPSPETQKFTAQATVTPPVTSEAPAQETPVKPETAVPIKPVTQEPATLVTQTEAPEIPPTEPPAPKMVIVNGERSGEAIHSKDVHIQVGRTTGKPGQVQHVVVDNKQVKQDATSSPTPEQGIKQTGTTEETGTTGGTTSTSPPTSSEQKKRKKPCGTKKPDAMSTSAPTWTPDNNPTAHRMDLWRAVPEFDEPVRTKTSPKDNNSYQENNGHFFAAIIFFAIILVSVIISSMLYFYKDEPTNTRGLSYYDSEMGYTQVESEDLDKAESFRKQGSVSHS